MRTLAVAFVVAVGLTACSSTDDPSDPQVSASTVLQQDVNTFCDDVRDAISQDPSEDQAQRLAELQKVAQNLGLGTRDDMYAAEAFNACDQQLQDAINAG